MKNYNKKVIEKVTKDLSNDEPILKDESDAEKEIQEDNIVDEVVNEVVDDTTIYSEVDILKRDMQNINNTISSMSQGISHLQNVFDDVKSDTTTTRGELLEVRKEKAQDFLNEIISVGRILTEFNTSIDEQRKLNSELFEAEQGVKYYKGFPRWIEMTEKRVVTLNEFLLLLQQKAKNINIVLNILVNKLKIEER